MPRSEKKTDIFGNEYTQHYDDDGNKAGWSEEKTDIFGDTYDQHFDSGGNKTGWSEERTDLFGDKYDQHFDSGWKKTGWSEERTDLFGDKYDQHFDSDWKKTGWSEEKTTIFGDRYTKHHGDAGRKVGWAEHPNDTYKNKSQDVDTSSLSSGYRPSNQRQMNAKSSGHSDTNPTAGGFFAIPVLLLIVALAFAVFQPSEEAPQPRPELNVDNVGPDYFNIVEYLLGEYCVTGVCSYWERSELFCEETCRFSGVEGHYLIRRVNRDEVIEALPQSGRHHVMFFQQAIPRGFPRNDVSEISSFDYSYFVVGDGCVDFLCSALLVAIVAEYEAHIVEIDLRQTP